MRSIHIPSYLAKFIMAVLIFMSYKTSYAIEPSIAIHQANQSDAYGLSLGVSNNLFKSKEFNWVINYNRLQNINIEWKNANKDFSIDTIDLMLSYRYSPKSYISFVRSLTFEFQAGAGVTLTKNKFLWSPLHKEKGVSGQGDINGVVSFLVHKDLNKKLSMNIGAKHYPDYSEFGDISSLFLGFSYRFGKTLGY